MADKSQGDRTRIRFAQALKRRLAVEPLSKVSVASLARDIGVDRQTFYYHFTDIFDALDYLCELEFPLFAEEEFWNLPNEQRVADMLGMLDSKRDLVRVLLRAGGDAMVRHHVRNPLQASIRAEIERGFAAAGRSTQRCRREIDAAVDYLAVALCAIDTDWVTRDEGRCSLTEMCRRQESLVNDTIAGLIARSDAVSEVHREPWRPANQAAVL